LRLSTSYALSRHVFSYQIPPLCSGKTCLVVSPLISLMSDQVKALHARGVRAASLSGGGCAPPRPARPSHPSARDVLARAAAGEFSVLYASPERLEGLPDSFFSQARARSCQKLRPP